MSGGLIVIISFLYLAILFGLAFWGEKRAGKQKSLVNNPYVYSLSLAVYCTAWTYFGSVGRAYSGGIDFLTIYMGPTFMMPLWYIVMRKMIRICKVQRITSLADFISSRYDKSVGLGTLVTIFCVIGILPYIALQIKALDFGIQILQADSMSGFTITTSASILSDNAFYLALVLGFFTIIYGARKADVTERHEGMVTAIAFESILKLFAFLLVGIFVCWFAFDSPKAIFSLAAEQEALSKLFVFDGSSHYLEWLGISLLAAFALVLLPRQFQVSVVENVNEQHIEKAIWLFPAYLLLINLFVIPIAFGGYLLFQNQVVDPDTFVLAIPLLFENNWIAIIAYLGGFAAATSMIIVSTIALSTMISNQIIMPTLLNRPALLARLGNDLTKALLYMRRSSILVILILAYLYYRFAGQDISLINFGLISFVAVAQFAPAVFGGMYWKNASKRGAAAGIWAGFITWMLLLVLPSLPIIKEMSLIQRLPELLAFYEGPQSNILIAFFWSMFFNVTCYIYFSFSVKQSSRERNQAEVFVDINKYARVFEQSIMWKGLAYVKDIESILAKFMGEVKAKKQLKKYAAQQGKTIQSDERADAQLVNHAESLLAGAIGSASARIMMSSVVKEEEISINEVLDILKESQQIMSMNRELQDKSDELKRLSDRLWEVNEQLRLNDHLKDEFISTVTHEMRTPITAIKAFGEILLDNKELEDDERNQFLSVIVKEAVRMSRLINQVLDIERFDSGKQKLECTSCSIQEIINEAIASLEQLINDKKIVLVKDIQQQIPPIYADKDRILQVMINLISNAIKFVEEGSGKIIISAYYIDGDIKVNVIDNGKGINEEQPELLFDKFYQAQNQNTKKPEGSGLGLAITKKIIDHHGGKIWFDKGLKQGVKISFLIPSERKYRRKGAMDASEGVVAKD
ncbi:MAG: sensor histidine kinase [Cyclobacteriaceae bacterium]|nr:histidine kinase [Cyclobacteriaceae bacterium]MCH8515775.1 sensor histidine kinase [Cyclobacteriaceae bacterium]